MGRARGARRVTQVAEDPGVRRVELALPLPVQLPVLLEVGEGDERRRELLVDPAGVDPVLRSDLEHPPPAPISSLGGVRQPLEGEGQVDVLTGDGGIPLVPDAARVRGERRLQIELLPIVDMGT